MSIDSHAGESPAASPTSPQTGVALKSIKTQQGSASMTALQGALNILSASLAAAINAESQQIAKSAANKLALRATAALMPQVKATDIPAAIKTIGTIFAGKSSPDITKLQQAGQAANTVADPSVAGRDAEATLDASNAESEDKRQRLIKNVADVNGMKNEVAANA